MIYLLIKKKSYTSIQFLDLHSTCQGRHKKFSDKWTVQEYIAFMNVVISLEVLVFFFLIVEAFALNVYVCSASHLIKY